MDKKAIKTFAIESRKKLIEEVKYKASLLGITAKGIAEPVEKAAGIEVYDIGAFNPNTIYDEAIEQRKNLVKRINEKDFDNVVEEVAYTWFNRIIAIRFMEVNDYLPTRVRVLSSETEGKIEPDIVTEAPHIDLDFTQEGIKQIYRLKKDNKLDELFRLLFIKQCNKLNEILPELFEKTADYTELLLSISFTNEEGVVRQLIDNISEEDFTDQVEIIGWLYQYYNTELKDDTFKQLKKRVKISKERIPAATQLFTPDWIVKYMVENSLGRLWLDGHPDSSLKENWKYYLDEAEQEPEVQIDLVKIRKESKNLKPEDIKVIDPAMGSGHILVYAFDVLMHIYTSVGYSEREAAVSIIENNLYGLDIDNRAYQLAYFAVMMKARSYNRRILTKNIDPQICAIQESNKITDELVDFVADSDQNIRKDLQYLVETFKDAKEYGSIIDVKQLNFHNINFNLNELKNTKYSDFKSIKYQEMIDKVYPIYKQGLILSMKYDILITNPPYMGNRSMNNILSKFLKKNFPDSKTDIFAVFLEKCQTMLFDKRYLAMITQQSFMFLSSFEKLRKKILKKNIINMIHLGAKAFDEIGGEVVQTTSFIIQNNFNSNYKSKYLDLVDFNSQDSKEKAFFNKNEHVVKQKWFKKIPGSPIAYGVNKKFYDIFDNPKVSDFGFVGIGMRTSDNNRFLRYWYEISIKKFSDNCNSAKDVINGSYKWIPYNKGGSFRKWYGNQEYVVNWESNGLEIKENTKKLYPQLGDNLGWKISNEKYYFKKSITWSFISSRYLGARFSPTGFIFDVQGSSLFPPDDYLIYFTGFMCSKLSTIFLSVLNPTLSFQVVNIKTLPIIIPENNIKSNLEPMIESCISISKDDWDDYETSWNFKVHPLIKFCDKNLKKSFKNWEIFSKDRFKKLLHLEESINKTFIDIYDLNDVITPQVKENFITITKANLNKDIKSFVSYAVGCMLGRYSLNEEGLIYAGGQWDPSKYSKFIPDYDNIIPILDTEYFEDDIVGRFVEFVKVTFGEDTLEENLDFIAQALKKKGTTSREVIRNYFLTDFFKDHVKTYKKHPIYWLFDSGRNNGFKALIYMHRYEGDLVARVRTDYLHKTQKALETAITHSDRIIDTSTSASEKSKAVKAKNKLVKQLEETKKYDEALAHVANQKIEIDLDDGVKVNYAKFQGVEVSSEGQKAKKINLLKKI